MSEDMQYHHEMPGSIAHVGHVADKGHEHAGHEGHAAGADHGGHDHAKMIADFRKRFWVSLFLTIPILALSPFKDGYGFAAQL